MSDDLPLPLLRSILIVLPFRSSSLLMPLPVWSRLPCRRRRRAAERFPRDVSVVRLMAADPTPSASSRHVPVMPREVLAALDLAPGQVVVDGTVGGGGHSRLIAPKILPEGRLLGLDRDPMMLALAGRVVTGEHVHLIHSSYRDLPDVLKEFEIEFVDRMLIDLGLSSDQLADEHRGFGFDSDGPLDLRFDTTTGRAASTLIADSSLEDLVGILTDFGEEAFSERIAKSLKQRLPTTGRELSEAVVAAVPKQAANSRKHPATRVFQALRIAVNEELSHLRRTLTETLPPVMRDGGRLVVLSFHSLEDRILKHTFQGDPSWQPLTKKPQLPSPSETRNNPRSRSVKLRAAVRSSHR